MEATRRRVVVGLALVLLGTVGAAWAAGELAGGIAEIPRHWWSALATTPVAVGALLILLSLRSSGRT